MLPGWDLARRDLQGRRDQKDLKARADLWVVRVGGDGRWGTSTMALRIRIQHREYTDNETCRAGGSAERGIGERVCSPLRIIGRVHGCTLRTVVSRAVLVARVVARRGQREQALEPLYG